MEYLALNVIYCFVITLCVTFLALLIALKQISVLPKIVFSFLYVRWSQTFLENIVNEKRILFKDLNSLHSSDKELRAQNVIRILEIGAGPGSNFQFYPKNSKLTLLEPNQFFIKTLMDNQSKFRQVEEKAVVVGVAEDMFKIPDNSVDALVATYVLCSVQNVHQVLKEIHRVLAPGGKYFFLEHGYGSRSFWQYWFQVLLNPFWRLFTDGCQIVKNTIVDIEKCELFVNVNSRTLPPPVQASIFFSSRFRSQRLWNG